MFDDGGIGNIGVSLIVLSDTPTFQLQSKYYSAKFIEGIWVSITSSRLLSNSLNKIFLIIFSLPLFASTHFHQFNLSLYADGAFFFLHTNIVHILYMMRVQQQRTHMHSRQRTKKNYSSTFHGKIPKKKKTASVARPCTRPDAKKHNEK